MRNALRIVGILAAVMLAAQPVRVAEAAETSAASQAPDAKVTDQFIANVRSIEPGKPFKVGVQFDVPSGFYFYYKDSGSFSMPTKIAVSAPEGFTVGKIEFPTPVVKYDVINGKTPVSSNVYKSDTLVFAEVTPPADLKPGSDVTISAKVSYQYCSTGCVPVPKHKLELTLPVAATAEPSAQAAAFASAERKLPLTLSENKYVRITARLNGELHSASANNYTLSVMVEPTEGYKLQQNQPTVAGLVSTDLVVSASEGIKLGAPIYPEPMKPSKPIPGFGNVKVYEKPFTIDVPLKSTQAMTSSAVTFDGILKFQACNAETCFPPQAVGFSLTAPVDPTPLAVTPSMKPATPEEIGVMGAATTTGALVGPGDARPATLGTVLDKLSFVEARATEESFGMYLFYAYIGGFILNFMPCVLPVIAIKVLSFVHQAGENRQRIFLLNVAYSGGVVLVFLGLATLAVVANVGWGGLFQLAQFNLVMAGLVFAMGLSLLGVFEIPVPGMMGSGGQHREGLFGAFLTGVLATLLATPCSGPFLGVVLGWSVRQPALVTYLVWGMMGLGMATPYLVIGMFPRAVKMLPKPGNWMVRFKEFAGLFLMGTVVFIMNNINPIYLMPTLVVLVGIGASLWMVGSLYNLNSTPKHKNIVRSLAAFSCLAVSAFAYFVVLPSAEGRQERLLATYKENWLKELHTSGLDVASDVELPGVLPWQTFTPERLNKLLGEGRTVVVDFTAVWCLTCKTNEAVALEQEATKDLMQRFNAVPLYADYTEQSPEIREWLDKFHAIGVPLTVIFPGTRPNQPIVLRDLYSKAELLSAIEKAGPSRGVDLDGAAANSPTAQVANTPSSIQ